MVLEITQREHTAVFHVHITKRLELGKRTPAAQPSLIGYALTNVVRRVARSLKSALDLLSKAKICELEFRTCSGVLVEEVLWLKGSGVKRARGGKERQEKEKKKDNVED